MKTPTLYYKVRIKESGKSDRFEFITQAEARRRGLTVRSDAVEYVRVSPQTYTPYGLWKRQQASKRRK